MNRPLDREVPCVYNGISFKKPTRRSDTGNSLYSIDVSREQPFSVSPVTRESILGEEDVRTTSRTSLHEHQERPVIFQDTSSANGGHSSSQQLEIETLLAVNHQTSGTEFYGQSSNFVSLNELLSKTRQLISTNLAIPVSTERHPVSPFRPHSSIESPTPSTARSHSVQTPSLAQNLALIDSSQTPISVVNLLCDESATLPEPRPTSPVTVAGRAQKQPSTAPVTPATVQTYSPHNSNEAQQSKISRTRLQIDGDQVTTQNSSDCFFGNPMLLEIEYVNLYFHNLHNVSPFLDSEKFKSRCGREIWAASALKRLRRKQMHFLALYNAVLAVGALTAPTDAFENSRAELGPPLEENRAHDRKLVPSSIRLSRLYFQRARRLLGDVFEICSLEGAQTLLLLVCISPTKS